MKVLFGIFETSRETSENGPAKEMILLCHRHSKKMIFLAESNPISIKEVITAHEKFAGTEAKEY